MNRAPPRRSAEGATVLSSELIDEKSSGRSHADVYVCHVVPTQAMRLRYQGRRPPAPMACGLTRSNVALFSSLDRRDTSASSRTRGCDLLNNRRAHSAIADAANEPGACAGLDVPPARINEHHPWD